MNIYVEQRVGDPPVKPGTWANNCNPTACILVELCVRSWLDNIEAEKLKVLADMYDRQACTDVVIQCCDHQLIHAHRDVLASRSQLFNVALKKSSRKCGVLEVKYLHFKYVRAIVDLMYHNKVVIERADIGRLVYLMQQFQLRWVFGDMSAEGLLLQLSGKKLLGEHFDRLFEYTVATPVPKARQARDIQHPAGHTEPYPIFPSRARCSKTSNSATKDQKDHHQEDTVESDQEVVFISERVRPKRVAQQKNSRKSRPIIPERVCVNSVEEETVKSDKEVVVICERVRPKPLPTVKSRRSQPVVTAKRSFNSFEEKTVELDQEVVAISEEVKRRTLPEGKSRRRLCPAVQTKESLNSFEEKVVESGQEASPSQKTRGRSLSALKNPKRPRLSVPTKAAYDYLVDVAAPKQCPRSVVSLTRSSEKAENATPVVATPTPKAKYRKMTADTKLCLDALADNTSKYTNVDIHGNKIPRPPNAFMIFGQDFRKLLAEENVGDSNKAISVALGHAWSTLSDCERRAYYELQELYKQQHQALYPGYAYCPAQARRQKALRRRTC